MYHFKTAVMEVRRMKERQKLARQQERYHRQMQLRMERELRSRQINEVGFVKQSFASVKFYLADILY